MSENIDYIPSAELDETATFHLERLRNQTTHKFTMARAAQWVERHTYLAGRPYSYTNHEYQKRILEDVGQETVIRKCSQIGMSEASARFALAMVGVNPDYTVIYTLPTSGMATTFVKARVDPIVEGSPYLSGMIHKSTDNSEVKRFGGSFIYFRGCQSNNAPISIPADHLIHDEVDFSDLNVIEQYQSRLTHSPYKRKTMLSTPTQPGVGIDAMFEESQRSFQFVKCCHCSHYFIPDYFKHIYIPGYTGELKDIRKNTLRHLDYRKAELRCPNCDKVPSLQLEHREWVVENPMDNYMARGFQVSPFDAPNLHDDVHSGMPPGHGLLPFLIDASTKYGRVGDFINYNLGQPTEDDELTLTKDDMTKMMVSPSQVPLTGDGNYVVGLDLGGLCHFVVGRILPDGRLLIERREKTPNTKVRERRMELSRRYWPRVSVADNQPYEETILAMQAHDRNLYGAYYEDRKTLESYRFKSREEDDVQGLEPLKQVHINRNRAFDYLLEDIRQGNVICLTDGKENDDEWIAHLTDMRRVRRFSRDQNEMDFNWLKSKKGEDHYHHALLYCYIASKMIKVSSRRVGMGLPVGSLRLKGRL